jgi:hypothetical protein
MIFFFSNLLGLPADRNRTLPGPAAIFVAPVNEQQCGMELCDGLPFSGGAFRHVVGE